MELVYASSTTNTQPTLPRVYVRSERMIAVYSCEAREQPDTVAGSHEWNVRDAAGKVGGPVIQL